MTLLLAVTPWYAWAGWALIGTVAQVISLVALIIAVSEWRRARRGFVPVAWDFVLYGNGTIDGKTFHIAELTNAGSGTAKILQAGFIGARFYPHPEFPNRTVLATGESNKVLLTAEKINECWLYLVWMSHSDASTIAVEWIPVTPAMEQQLEDSIGRMPKRRWWLPFVGRAPRPVGPNFYWRSRVRAKHKYRNNDLKVATSNFAGSVTTLWAYGGGNVKDIPVEKF